MNVFNSQHARAQPPFLAVPGYVRSRRLSCESGNARSHAASLDYTSTSNRRADRGLPFGIPSVLRSQVNDESSIPSASDGQRCSRPSTVKPSIRALTLGAGDSRSSRSGAARRSRNAGYGADCGQHHSRPIDHALVRPGGRTRLPSSIILVFSVFCPWSNSKVIRGFGARSKSRKSTLSAKPLVCVAYSGHACSLTSWLALFTKRQ